MNSLNRSNAEAMNACEDYDCNDDDAFSWSRREAARIKQIQIGKARPEYLRYIREVQPSRRHSSQPGTPDPRARVSKRQFDRALGDWRRRLHEFDAVPRCVRGQPGNEAEVLAGPSPNGQLSGKGAWGNPEKKGCGKGAFGKANPQMQITEERAGPRSTNRRSRGGAVLPVTRGERCGKFGPRKQADSHDGLSKDDPLPLTAPPMPPPPPPPTAAPSCVGDVATTQTGAVRISLADQLMEMPMQPMVPPPPEWQWYQSPEAMWGTMETPQKNPMMGMADPQFMMTMETPPDKPMMPGHSMTSQMYDKDGMLKELQFMAMETPTDPTSFQQMYNDSMLKVPMLGAPLGYGLDGMGMTMDYDLLPNRLFDSSPEKSDHMNESHSSNSEVEGGETTQTADQVPGSPRSRPRTLTDSLLLLKSPCMASPNMRMFSSPMPATPKRPFYVPETPSPDRMHWSSMQSHALPYGQPAPNPNPAAFSGLPWGCPLGGGPMGLPYGAQAHEQVIPEFLQMPFNGSQQIMPMMAHNELQPFGELGQ